MKKRVKHQYVVGFHRDIDCVYGPNRKDQGGVSIVTYIDKMTLNQAKRKAGELHATKRIRRVIFKLVPVAYVK